MPSEFFLPRKVTHRRKAEQQGVTVRTLDRWIAAGIIERPDQVNGRNYHREDSEPQRGPARGKPIGARRSAAEIRKEV
jgi:predicted site-specific integrase-resolvase